MNKQPNKERNVVSTEADSEDLLASLAPNFEIINSRTQEECKVLKELSEKLSSIFQRAYDRVGEEAHAALTESLKKKSFESLGGNIRFILENKLNRFFPNLNDLSIFDLKEMIDFLSLNEDATSLPEVKVITDVQGDVAKKATSLRIMGKKENANKMSEYLDALTIALKETNLDNRNGLLDVILEIQNLKISERKRNIPSLDEIEAELEQKTINALIDRNHGLRSRVHDMLNPVSELKEKGPFYHIKLGDFLNIVRSIQWGYSQHEDFSRLTFDTYKETLNQLKEILEIEGRESEEFKDGIKNLERLEADYPALVKMLLTSPVYLEKRKDLRGESNSNEI